MRVQGMLTLKTKLHVQCCQLHSQLLFVVMMMPCESWFQQQLNASAGVNLLQESNLIAGFLLNAMFLLGTFTFAVVLGVVSDDISSEVKV